MPVQKTGMEVPRKTTNVAYTTGEADHTTAPRHTPMSPRRFARTHGGGSGETETPDRTRSGDRMS